MSFFGLNHPRFFGLKPPRFFGLKRGGFIGLKPPRLFGLKHLGTGRWTGDDRGVTAGYERVNTRRGRGGDGVASRTVGR